MATWSSRLIISPGLSWCSMRWSIFGVLAHDLTLVPRLLDPLHTAPTGTPHRAGKGPRPGAGGHEHRIATAPGSVDRGAVVQGPTSTCTAVAAGWFRTMAFPERH